MSWLIAMMIQQMHTYGDILSPIRAHFQKRPNMPVLFLSKTAGHMEWMYVDVHMRRISTCSRDVKLKRADCVRGDVSNAC